MPFQYSLSHYFSMDLSIRELIRLVYCAHAPCVVSTLTNRQKSRGSAGDFATSQDRFGQDSSMRTNVLDSGGRWGNSTQVNAFVGMIS